MIRNESEYKEALKRIEEEKSLIKIQHKKLKEKKLKESAVELAMEPILTFHQQLIEEVESYEKLKRGQIGEFYNLEGLGRTLIALRIAKGLTQKELAKTLDVHETQISRDERNEYRGASIEKVNAVLNALKVQMVSKVKSLEA